MSDKIFNIYEAKTAFSLLVERASEGEELIIARAGTPVAKLVPFTEGHTKRKPGGWEGKMRIGDDFDDPLPADVLAAFGLHKP